MRPTLCAMVVLLAVAPCAMAQHDTVSTVNLMDFVHRPELPPLTPLHRGMHYITCDGSKWTAQYRANGFQHTPAAPDGAHVAHDDKIIVYRTWDNTCWVTRWDEAQDKFVHTPQGGGPSHADNIINYLDWQNLKQTAMRHSDGRVSYKTGGGRHSARGKKERAPS